jgi:transposase
MVTELCRGYTTADIAARFRVSEDKVRGWIKRGELLAINTADVKCGKPRYVVTPEALAAFEQGRGAAEPKPAPRRKRRTAEVDYFPNW